MKNSCKWANILFNLAMALLLGLLPFLGLASLAPESALAGSTDYDAQTWDTVQGWVKNCQVQYVEGSLVRQRLILTNGTSDNWTTEPIKLVYDFYKPPQDSIGIDFLTDFKSAGSEAYSQPPEWWDTNGTPFTPSVVNQPYPPGTNDLPPSSPADFHYCQIGPYTLLPGEQLIISWYAHASMTIEWKLTPPGGYGPHNGSCYFPGASLQTKLEHTGWGAKSTQFPVACAQGSISGHKYLDTPPLGTYNSGDTGIPNWTIYLSGTMPDGRPLNVQKTTSADGSYSFPGLSDGTWTVSEELKSGYTHTSPDTIPATISATQRVYTNIDFFNRLEVPTVFPEVPTQCPVASTTCPAVPTQCPVVSTTCPEIPTQCPANPTFCPETSTQCPAAETTCPEVSTQCPSVETQCPPTETSCPPSETSCPPTETQCPVASTTCPEVSTQCPVAETTCPEVSTQCPVETTVCPVETTVCPVVVTTCPMVQTVCPTCPSSTLPGVIGQPTGIGQQPSRGWPKPPQILSLTNAQFLNVWPRQTSAGQPVTITTNVANNGTDIGNYTVNLKINGQVEQTKTVSVGPGSTYPVKFTVTKDQPGTYSVNIDGQRDSFIILGTEDASTGDDTTGSHTSGVMIAIVAGAVVIIITSVLLMFIFRRRRH
jgi:hypothetical protein